MIASSPRSLPTVPRKNVPFLDAFNVIHGPPQLMGRFFLIADQRLRARGIELSFADFGEVVETHKQNQANWGYFNPMFDPRIAHVPPDKTMCLVGRDSSGSIVATAAAKYFDASVSTFAEIVNRGDFFSIIPDRNDRKMETRITAPLAQSMRGHIGYCGGIWVHPNYRGLHLPSAVAHIINACMLTLWDTQFLLGFVRKEVIGTRLHARYGFSNHQPAFVIREFDRDLIHAELLWSSADDAIQATARFIDEFWSEVDAAVISRDRQQRMR